jgi:hypothetical protein
MCEANSSFCYKLQTNTSANNLSISSPTFSNILTIRDNPGSVGVSTTTPYYNLTVASTTGAQLSLSAGADIAQWVQRNAGGNLYFATTKFEGFIDDARIYDRALSPSEVKRMAQSQVFTRYFSIENTCRTANSSSSLEAAPCSFGYFIDPSTQKVTALVTWPTAQASGEVKLVEFLTRWKNEIFHQSDWSGGSGQEGPISVPNNRFASSTNVNVDSQGRIRIEGL